ncbi:hypothetical protein VC83_09574, partial [Pseudogymnoascus destructans]
MSTAIQSHRQQPGLACEDCRRRKARCDRVRPVCGSCQDSGNTCRYVDKWPRGGPRKGQMLALKNLVTNLEQRLGEQMRKAQPDHDAILSDTRINPDASLAETEPATLSTHLENDTLGSAAFESTGLDCTSLE